VVRTQDGGVRRRGVFPVLAERRLRRGDREMSLTRPTLGRVRSACQFTEDALFKLHRLQVLLENHMPVPDALFAEARFNLQQANHYFNAGEPMPSNVIELTARQGQEALASIRRLITEGCAMAPTVLNDPADAGLTDETIPTIGGLFHPADLGRPSDSEAPSETSPGDAA
jgi:hypothetical protein